MKNIKLILVAVSLSVVGFNMASGVITPPPPPTNQKCIDSCTKSCNTPPAPAPSTVWTPECTSCLTTNGCITTNTIQDNVRTTGGTGGNVQTSISSSCMQQSCANKCPEAISKLNNAQ